MWCGDGAFPCGGHLVLGWHCGWGGGGWRGSAWRGLVKDGFRLRVRFILLHSVEWGQICFQKGPCPPSPPVPLCSGHPDILSCPIHRTPCCPRVFALTVPSTGRPCPPDSAWQGPYPSQACVQTLWPQRISSLTLCRADSPSSTPSSIPLFTSSFKTLNQP